jgi:2-keto-4-pentenoate hydratase
MPPHTLSRGWKIGATGHDAPKALGLSGPLSGPLWRDALVVSGATLPLFAAHRPKAEVELAVRLDSAPVTDDPHAVHSAIGAVGLAIEITGNRLSRDLHPAGPGFIADHGGANHVVFGDMVETPSADSFPSIMADLHIDGAHASSGTGDSVLGSPLAALCWLVSHLVERGRPLSAGDVVITGAIVGLTDFKIGAVLSASSAGLPDVTVQTVEART